MFDKFAYDMNEGLKFLNIEIDNDKIKKFYDFYEELVRVNQYMNLTAITEIWFLSDFLLHIFLGF